MTLAYVHPIVQAAATLAALYLLYLGSFRFRSLHLGHKTGFKRKLHVGLGRPAMIVLVLGILGGLIFVRWAWRGWLITGPHGWLGLAALPLILFGLISGWVMASRPKPRKNLALAHGLVNTVLVIVLLIQFRLGDEVLDTLVKGL